jgi:hypothetical protein
VVEVVDEDDVVSAIEHVVVPEIAMRQLPRERPVAAVLMDVADDVRERLGGVCEPRLLCRRRPGPDPFHATRGGLQRILGGDVVYEARRFAVRARGDRSENVVHPAQDAQACFASVPGIHVTVVVDVLFDLDKAVVDQRPVVAT